MKKFKTFIKENKEKALNEDAWNDQLKKTLKDLAIIAGYKRPTVGDGYNAIDDYRKGVGKFKGTGRKSLQKVQDWINKHGGNVSMLWLKNMLGL